MARRPFNDTQYPVTITTEYGEPEAGTRRGYHTGVDYALNTGVEILAPTSGQILRNGDGTASTDGRGYFVVLRGDDGIYHQIFHMSHMGTAGGHVNEGDVIGYVGSTGFATGPHIHWETTTRDDRTSDFAPADWLFKGADVTVTPPTPAPSAVTHEYVQIFGDYRTFYASPRGKVVTKLLPNNYGGVLTYLVLAHDGDYVQILRQDGSGTGWIYCGSDVSDLTKFYHA